MQALNSLRKTTTYVHLNFDIITQYSTFRHYIFDSLFTVGAIDNNDVDTFSASAI